MSLKQIKNIERKIEKEEQYLVELKNKRKELLLEQEQVETFGTCIIDVLGRKEINDYDLDSLRVMLEQQKHMIQKKAHEENQEEDSNPNDNPNYENA